MGSGHLTCTSSAGPKSCTAPRPGEEVTPPLALSAVSTFRSLAQGPGNSQSPAHGAACSGFCVDLGLLGW